MVSTRVLRRALACLAGAGALSLAPAIAVGGEGGVLIVAPHPDDEVLGFAGIMEEARQQGREVTVAVVTNGEGNGSSQTTIDNALRRNRESDGAISHLLLNGAATGAWSSDLSQAKLVFLGYPGRRQLDDLLETATCTGTGDAFSASIGQAETWAEDFDGNASTIDGDYHFLRGGSNACYSRESLVDDLADLIQRTDARDIYTTAEFDEHDDHQATFVAVREAMDRVGSPASLNATQIHSPHGASSAVVEAEQWPNPSLVGSGPCNSNFTLDTCKDRFTPGSSFRPHADGVDDSIAPAWGTQGVQWAWPGYKDNPAPNDPIWHEVPASMRADDLIKNPGWDGGGANEDPDTCGLYQSTNLKLILINHYCSQVWPRASEHGYFLAFVKRNEFYWRFTPPAVTVTDDGATQTSTSQIHATWSTPSGQGAAAAGYMVAVGTTPTTTDVRGWQNVGGVNETTIGGLDLVPGTTYHVRVAPYADHPETVAPGIPAPATRLVGAASASDGITPSDPGTGGGGAPTPPAPPAPGGATGPETPPTGGTTGTVAKATVALRPTFRLVRAGARWTLVVGGKASLTQAGRRPLIQQRRGRRTVTLGRARIRPNGTIAGSFRVPAKGAVRARAMLGATASAKAARTSFRRALQTASLRGVRVRVTGPARARVLRVSGRTQRAHRGRRVLVQMRVGKRLRTVGRLRVLANGRFAGTVRVPRNGRTAFRATLPGDARTANAVSPFRTVRV